MNTYAVDFETTYDQHRDIRSMGVVAYLRDPQTKIYMVSVAGDDGFRYVGPPQEFDWSLIAGGEWVAHNRSFDLACYMELVRRQEIANVPPPVWHCTADLVAFCGLPRSLAQSAPRVLGKYGRMSKDTRTAMKGRTAASIYADPEFLKQCQDYAMKDAELCLAIWKTLGHTMPPLERWLSWHTSMMGMRGVPVSPAWFEESRKALEAFRMKTVANIPWYVDCDEEQSILSPRVMRAHCRLAGISVPASTARTSEVFEKWLEENRASAPFMDDLIAYRSINRSAEVLKKMHVASGGGDRMPYSLKYYGGHTGRWSGDSGINMQNMPRDPLAGVKLRNAIVAPEGKTLVVADFAQIEARVLLWLAQDEYQLNTIRGGLSVYEAHARATMGYDGLSPMKEHNPSLYQLAKARVLACGYGVGAGRFQSMAHTLANLELSEEECQETVRSFRRSNPLITALWRKLEREFQLTARRNKSRAKDAPIEDFEISLPSGRTVIYRSPRCEPSERDTHQWEFWGDTARGRTKAYGGLLCENLVQATARDVLAEAVYRLESAGFPVILHVHDEVVLECSADPDTALISQLMCQSPSWAHGLPIDIDLQVLAQYDK